MSRTPAPRGRVKCSVPQCGALKHLLQRYILNLCNSNVQVKYGMMQPCGNTCTPTDQTSQDKYWTIKEALKMINHDKMDEM